MSHLVSVSYQSGVIIFLLTCSNKPPEHHQTPDWSWTVGRGNMFKFGMQPGILRPRTKKKSAITHLLLNTLFSNEHSSVLSNSNYFWSSAVREDLLVFSCFLFSPTENKSKYNWENCWNIYCLPQISLYFKDKLTWKKWLRLRWNCKVSLQWRTPLGAKCYKQCFSEMKNLSSR